MREGFLKSFKGALLGPSSQSSISLTAWLRLKTDLARVYEGLSRTSNRDCQKRLITSQGSCVDLINHMQMATSKGSNARSS